MVILITGKLMTMAEKTSKNETGIIYPGSAFTLTETGLILINY